MDRILILGATGTVGRHVASQLAATGAKVRVVVRNPDTARLPAEIEVVQGDLRIPETLDRPLEDVEAVFLVWTAPVEFAARALERIVNQARRIVFLSAPLKTAHPFSNNRIRRVIWPRRSERTDSAVSVIDSAGKRLKIPAWMLSPEAARIVISQQIHLSKEALLSLAALLSLHTGKSRGHDNLSPTAVKECKGGHRGATETIGPGDSGRKGDRARRCDSAHRASRSDGSHSGGGFSSERRKG